MWHHKYPKLYESIDLWNLIPDRRYDINIMIGMGKICTFHGKIKKCYYHSFSINISALVLCLSFRVFDRFWIDLGHFIRFHFQRLLPQVAQAYYESPEQHSPT